LAAVEYCWLLLVGLHLRSRWLWCLELARRSLEYIVNPPGVRQHDELVKRHKVKRNHFI
jgi:hypothetical protein